MSVDIKLAQRNISPSCLQDILDLLDADQEEEAKEILKEYEVEMYD